jgi:hypothetical protein
MFMYSYYVCNIQCIQFHCVVLCIVLFVNVYCTTATGCQPNYSKQIYNIPEDSGLQHNDVINLSSARITYVVSRAVN